MTQCKFLDVFPDADGHDVQRECTNEAVYLMDDVPACQKCHDMLVAEEGEDFFETVPIRGE